MKQTITGFFSQDLDQAIEVAKRNNLRAICLASYQNKPIIEMSDADVRDLLTKLKKEKLDIALIDAGIKPYRVDQRNAHLEALDEFKYIIKLSQKLKVDYIAIDLPIFHDVMEAFVDIKACLDPFIEQALMNHKTIILKPSKAYNSNVYAYLFKKLPSDALKIAYDPVVIVNNGESTTTSYRLLKKNIGVFIARDQTLDGKPELLGYGHTDMLNVFKRLIRDKFQGIIIADHDFTVTDFNYQPEKVNFFKRILGREKKRLDTYVQTLQKRLFPDEPHRLVTLDDIQDNQIKVLRVVFK